MKKLLCSLLFYFLSFSVFAITDIKFYENGKFASQIRNDKIYTYESENIYIIQNDKLIPMSQNYLPGTIKETENKIVINFFSDDELFVYREYSKATGFLLLEKNYSNGEIYYEFNETTGLLYKTSYLKEKKLDCYEINEYENNQLIKISYFNSTNTLTAYGILSYDKKTGNLLKAIKYNSSNQIIVILDWDIKTGNRIKRQEFSEDGSLMNEIFYDQKTGVKNYKLLYKEGTKNSEKWTYIKFDDDGCYELDSVYYISVNFCSYDYVEKYVNTESDWNDTYSAVIKKCNFTKKKSEYEVILTYIQNKHYLFDQRVVTLCNKDSKLFYCFKINDDDQIDISSCYEVQLIKKKIDYSAMNKSGKGKGPFGFDIGMTYDEVKEACGGESLEYISDDRYYVKPRKQHPLFKKYIVWISDSYGLYYIKAISDNIYTTEYGAEVKSKFNELLRPLEKKYGKFVITDKLESDYYWKEEQYWMWGLKDGARTYSASWFASKSDVLRFDGLTEIGMGIERINDYSTDKAYIWLEYEFANWEDAQEALDDVL